MSAGIHKNWIATIVCNGPAMTAAALSSFDRQDVGDLGVCLYRNSGEPWVDTLRADFVMRSNVRVSVAYAWNQMIRGCFSEGGDHVLVCNNDIELHPATYRLLLADGGDFVTPVGTLDRPSVMEAKESDFRPDDKRPHPDFSCFLVRRAAWEAVGPFDEGFDGAYCEDGDYHLRLHKAGVDAHSIGVPFFHRVSGTIKSDPNGAEAIHRQADKNRRRFRQKWGFDQGSEAYYAFFKQEGQCRVSR